MSNLLSRYYEYYDMCYNTFTTETRVFTTNAKIYEVPGSFVTIQLFKKEAESSGYGRNQKLTFTLLELEQISSQFDKIQDLTETKTQKTLEEKTMGKKSVRNLKKIPGSKS